MHYSRGSVLWRGLEFHVCTINKSARTKKKSGNLFNDPCICLKINLIEWQDFELTYFEIRRQLFNLYATYNSSLCIQYMHSLIQFILEWKKWRMVWFCFVSFWGTSAISGYLKHLYTYKWNIYNLVYFSFMA